MVKVIQRYRSPFLSNSSRNSLISTLNHRLANKEGGRVILSNIRTELCFNIEIQTDSEKNDFESKLNWLLSLPAWQDATLTEKSLFHTSTQSETDLLVEVAPRLNFTTAFSTNAVSIARTIGLDCVTRLEISKRYLLEFQLPIDSDKSIIMEKLLDHLHDKMTEHIIHQPIKSFALAPRASQVSRVDILNLGQSALEEINKVMGLAFDSWDIDYYSNLFKDRLCRNPSDVECFDLAQSNSEHSRHWFFRGRLFIDNKEVPTSLFDLIMATQNNTNPNNVIKFSDNSSAIEGFLVSPLLPQSIGQPTMLRPTARMRHIIFTAETHNFPTGVAPFPGATTGTGGRIRDVQATGRGAHLIAGTAGYSFGNLHLPGYSLPWEKEMTRPFHWPDRMAVPSMVAVEASNGASDYGNKIGEPVLAGYARSCGLWSGGDANVGEWREWVKPIMFSGGIGQLEAVHVLKESPEAGMLVVKVGGPVYRIGVGGGAASSIDIQGSQASELDLQAVQRGDAEMEQKMNRVIRACIECDSNPILSIHDQGAGGNGNVLKEICEPAGAMIEADEFQLGDPTITLLELWGAEYQETNALLIRQSDRQMLQKICDREKCPVAFVGKITGDGRIRLKDFSTKNGADVNVGDVAHINGNGEQTRKDELYPVDLELDVVLGKMPKKEFRLEETPAVLRPLALPTDLNIISALHRVLRLPSVASKRYLTNKVDRSVTGLVAQQQCVGPLHTPLADVAVVSLSHFDTCGGATAIGEQPIKCLISDAAGARLSVVEALTNLSLARITCLPDVKVSGNWMWPAKLPGEGARLFRACEALCQFLGEIGVGIDGGKDSLGMAAVTSSGKDASKMSVKSPGCLVVSAYAPCPDIRKTVTPDLKGNAELFWIKLSDQSLYRLGGSALAQVYNQLGDECPDVENANHFVKAFHAVQELVKNGVLSSGHDISDGGWITCLLEMAFAGNCGFDVDLTGSSSVPVINALFHEEPGWIIEVKQENVPQLKNICSSVDSITLVSIGKSTDISSVDKMSRVNLKVNGLNILENDLVCELRDIWEETSHHLELLQCAPQCAQSERDNLKVAVSPAYKFTFRSLPPLTQRLSAPPRVAVLREEGSNGDREMAAAFYMAGFEVWDITVQDLLSGGVNLNQFRGISFVGGFSYADVLGSARGWAGTIRYHSALRSQFESFKSRPDTFSLGICNGCQLMAWIGWIDTSSADQQETVFLDHNDSGRFESRFSYVTIPENSNAMMFKNMAGSQLGIWVAHGEGKFTFRDKQIISEYQNLGSIALQYCNPIDNLPTENYPFNPNGSPMGIAGLSSCDGRHLALMPHPERCILPWQWPYAPSKTWEGFINEPKGSAAPWLKMFHNAYEWCVSA